MTMPATAPLPQPKKGVSLAKRGDAPLVGKGANISRLVSIYNQDGAKRLVLLKYAQVGIIVALIGLIALTIDFTAVKVRIFATTAEGKLYSPPPVDQELGDNAAALCVTDALYRIMTMGYHDKDIRLSQNRIYFTEQGWESYTRYLRTSNDGQPSVRSQLDNDFMTMWLTNNDPPEILQKILVSGVFTYNIRIGLSVVKAIRGQETIRREIYEITLMRVPPEVNPQGLAIARWRFVANR
jgi:hypothetical protein